MEDKDDDFFPGVPKLPDWWSPLWGLRYPTTLSINGTIIEIQNYKQHHEIIQRIFLPIK